MEIILLSLQESQIEKMSKTLENRSSSLNLIKKLVNELLPDSRIILFGSRAKMDYSTDSDYDLMIVTKDTLDTGQKRDYQAHLRKKLAKHKIPADIIIQSEEEIKSKKEITGHIVREIMNEGISL